MNLLLLHPGEVAADGTAILSGRRALHAHAVLHAEPGQPLAAGLLDGPLGTAVVQSCKADELVVATQFDRPAPTADDVLLLAVCRPKVLLRMLAHAAALGFGQIALFRSWRVEKSHLQSTAMQPEVQQEQLVLGLEQAGRTALPKVTFHPLFKPFVQDAVPTLPLPSARFVAHPRAELDTAALQPGPGPFALALGPDGGFLPYEVDQLAARGFLPIQCGPAPLRTESALSVLWGQLDLLRRRATVLR